MNPETELPASRLKDVVENSHVNFLFGAGTSSSYFNVLGDIENDLTALDKSSLGKKRKALIQASIFANFFDGVLYKNRTLLDGDSESRQLRHDYRQFVRTLHQVLSQRRSTLLNKQVNIFTTNVDLAFELAMDELGMDVNDGFVGRFLPVFDTTNFGSLRYKQSGRYENISEVPTFNLFKIHGSVGWEIKDSGQQVDNEPRIVFDRELSLLNDIAQKLQEARKNLLATVENGVAVSLATLAIGSKARALDKSVEVFLTAYEKQVIVNPTKEKFRTTVLDQSYYELLRIFANVLEKENSVLFVHGFSFRDEHLRQLVLRAARSNPTLQIYVFCFRSDDKSSYQSLIPTEMVKNGNIAYVTPAVDDNGNDLDSNTLNVVTERFFLPLVSHSVRATEEQIAEDLQPIATNLHD
jgi:hypothetical protein